MTRRWVWNQRRGEYEFRQQVPALVAWLDPLLLGAAVLVPFALLLMALWLALPALWLDSPRLAEVVSRAGVGGLLAYLAAVAQWALVVMPAVLQQHWPWALIAGLGLLVVWVLREG